jgi:hypothetical protein
MASGGKNGAGEDQIRRECVKRRETNKFCIARTSPCFKDESEE